MSFNDGVPSISIRCQNCEAQFQLTDRGLERPADSPLRCPNCGRIGDRSATDAFLKVALEFLRVREQLQEAAGRMHREFGVTWSPAGLESKTRVE